MPQCGTGTLEIRHRRRDGKPFYGCTNFPRCRYARDVSATPINGGNHPSNPAPKFVPEPSLTARALYRGYTSILIQSAALPRKLFDELVAAHRLDTFVPHATWRLDLPDQPSRQLPSDAECAVINSALKLLLRGRLTHISPHLESVLAEKNDLPLDALSRVNASTLSRGCAAPDRNDELWFDGDGVEDRFYHEVLGRHFGPLLASHVIPQAHLSGLTGDAQGAQRVDFLVSLPGQRLVVELDDPKHASHAEKDGARDAALAASGFRVIRIPYQELDLGSGPHLSELEITLAVIPAESGVLDREQGFVALVRLAHQIQVALLTALQRGHLAATGGRTVCFHLDGLDLPEDLVRVGFTAAVNDLQQLVQRLASLYELAYDPGPIALQFVRDNEMASISSDTLCIALGRRLQTNATCYAIQNLFYEGTVDFPVTACVARYPISPRPVDLEYFLGYLFGMPSFREGQIDALSRILRGKDTIVLLPTGAGKSLIFQLAALLLPGICIAIDPLVSLIDDQIDNLKRQGIDRAVGITAELSKRNRIETVLARFGAGQYLFTYVSPERLQTPSFREALRQAGAFTAFNLIAIDETHCVSEWGHDFRTAYLNLARTVRAYCSAGKTVPPLVALTGTASRSVSKMCNVHSKSPNWTQSSRPRLSTGPIFCLASSAVFPPKKESNC